MFFHNDEKGFAMFAMQKACALNDQWMFKKVQQVVAVIFACAQECEIVLDDQRPGSLDPTIGQTAEGIFLQFWSNTPVYLYTPWGALMFCGGFRGHCTSVSKFADQLSNEFMWVKRKAPVSAVQEKLQKELLYAIHVVNEERVPTPHLLDPSCFSSQHDILKAWKKLQASS